MSDRTGGRLLKSIALYVAGCITLFGILVLAVGLYLPGAIIFVCGACAVYATWRSRKQATSSTKVINS